jgi:multidrug efflux pump subunit AcrA (membrane-fusion protein)
MSIALKRKPTSAVPQMVIGLAVIVLIIGLVTAAGLFRPRVTDTVIARRDIIAAVPIAGAATAPANAYAAIYSPYQAAVSRVYASVGQHVRKGEVIAELAQPQARFNYEQARANVKTAQANLDSAESQYAPMVEAARQQLRAAQSTAQNASTATTTAATPTGDVVVTQIGADPSQARVDLYTAQQQLANAKATRDAAVIPLRQQLEAAQIALKDAQSGVKAGTLHTPISGTVTAINIQQGQTPANPNKTPIAEIADLDSLQAQGNVAADAGASLRLGMPVRITFDGAPGETFAGKIARIDKAAASGDALTVTCDFENRQGVVKPGMKAQIDATIGEARGVLAVPNTAIHKDQQGRPAVTVVEGNKTRIATVTLGLTDGLYTEVLSGLRDGEQVRLEQTRAETNN